MRHLAVAFGLVVIAGVLILFIDVITSNVFAFCAVVLTFIFFLLIVGLFAPVKRNSRGHIL